jgi:diguanylate cyclase (GGDEF)-like protein
VPEIATGLAGRLYVLDESRHLMVEACSWADPVHSQREFPPLACWALRRGLPHRPAGENIDVPCAHFDVAGGEAVDSICLPLMPQHEMLGLLYFETSDAASARPQSSEVYVKMLAENIGLALANLRLREALRAQALVDPLTGLANRRQLDMVLDAEIGRAKYDQLLTSCLMIDVDHFKRFNDVHGHDAGDAVLARVGAVIKDATRDSDAAFRVGGEEFLLLLPGADVQVACERAEALRREINATDLYHEGRELGPVSVSIGVASTPEHGSLERLVRTADAALLRAKGEGRNRVVVAESRAAAAASDKMAARI